MPIALYIISLLGLATITALIGIGSSDALTGALMAMGIL